MVDRQSGMGNLRVTVCSLLVLGGLLVSARPALAAEGPPDDGVVIWNEDYTLGDNEELNGDLIVFNGDVNLEVGSRVTGSVVVLSGSAEVEGSVEEDLVVSGGDIYLRNGARIEGDVVCSWNCDLKQEEGSRVGGRIVEGMPFRAPRFERWRDLRQPRFPVRSPTGSWVSGARWVLGWGLKAVRSVVAIVVVAAAGALVGLIWPRQTAQVGRAVAEAPWPSFGVGLLTGAAATALIVALAITICLSPFSALLALGLSGAGLFGWVAIGALIGERLLRAVDAGEVAPLWAAGLGTLLVTLISTGLSAAFCLAPLGWAIVFTLGCLGLGAVVLTRFGTASYVQEGVAAASVAEADESFEPPEEGARDGELGEA